MQLTILGCGTSTGVPVIACKCKVCRSRNTKNHRTRASVWLQWKNKSILIDSSTDLRIQALREKMNRVDAVLYTHPHADHIYGIDDLRAFNFAQKSSIPVFGNSWTCSLLEHNFGYIFKKLKPEGGGVPQLDLHPISEHATSLQVVGLEVQILRVPHGSQECLGYRFENLAYLTDCHDIPQSTLQQMLGLKALVIDCLRTAPHPTHLHLEKTLEFIRILKPKKAFLTHLSHEFDYAQWTRRLPPGVFLAYDGQKIKV